MTHPKRAPWYESPAMALARFERMARRNRRQSLPGAAWRAIGERLHAASRVTSGERARHLRERSIDAYLRAGRAFRLGATVVEVAS